MPDLEVEVKLEGHPHIFLVDIESIVEAPKIGASLSCTRCGFKGIVSKVGIPGYKERDPDTSSTDDAQTSMLGGK